MMKKLIKQPLLHFLLLGIALFLVFDYNHTKTGAAAGDKSVLIDRNALLTFMQYRNQAFNEEYFSQQLDSMSKQNRQNLINDLVRDDVLYKEALAMHLEDNDYVIKRRLIQKMEFLTRGFITAGSSVTDADIRDYYRKHKEEYYQQPYVTFTNVFFDYDRHSPAQAMALAKKTLRELNEKHVSFNEGIKYGDRFLYYTNYVERSPDYVASHFGVKAEEAIFKLEPDDQHWYGPFQSPYGLHLVMLTEKKPGRFPDVKEIYGRVKDDAEQAMIKKKTDDAIDKLIDSYSVKVVLKDSR